MPDKQFPYLPEAENFSGDIIGGSEDRFGLARPEPADRSVRPAAPEERLPPVDMSVDLAGVKLRNPVVVASGTFGFGREYNQFYDLGELGGICAKGLTLHRREGNPAPRIAETPMGILNSVGLQNPGVDAFIEEELPFLRQFDTKVIANISGNTPEEYGVMCEKLSEAGVDYTASFCDRIIFLQDGNLAKEVKKENTADNFREDIWKTLCGLGGGKDDLF